MDLAIVTELFHPSVGGMEIRYLGLVPHLAARGHSVTVLTIDHAGSLAPEDHVQGARVLRLVRDAAYRRRRLFRRNPATILRFTRAAHGYLRCHKPDAVLYNQWPILPACYGRRTSARSIADICEFRTGRFWNAAEAKIIGGCHAAITVSQSLADRAEARFPGLRVRAISSGVDTSRYSVGTPRDLLFMGRLEPHKNPAVAVEAALQYGAATGDLRTIRIVGDGSLKGDLAARFSGNPHVEICGYVDDERKVEMLAHGAVLLLPSVREGFPLVIAECMASGVPVLTTDAGDNGSKDVVTQYGLGLAVPLGVESFAEGIASVLSNHGTYRANCLANRHRVDCSAIADELLSYIEDL